MVRNPFGISGELGFVARLMRPGGCVANPATQGCAYSLVTTLWIHLEDVERWSGGPDESGQTGLQDESRAPHCSQGR